MRGNNRGRYRSRGRFEIRNNFRPKKYTERRDQNPMNEGITDPKELPIFLNKQEIIENLTQNDTLIIEGETGCGKSTQIPQYILENWPDSKIVISQPRRLAAVSISTRVSKEMNTSLGDVVGYHIKGSKKYTENSKIIFMTTGMLVQELCSYESVKENYKLP